MKHALQLLWIAVLALVSFTVCAREQTNMIEPSESDDSITVQPNEYFEFSTEHHLNNEVDSYGDLIDVIKQLTAEKLQSFRDEEQSPSQRVSVATLTSNQKPDSSRASRTWKRRILVMVDGKRVTGTADRSMKIEEHLGTSLHTIESLEGFVSTEIDSLEFTYPRVLNFGTTPRIQEEASNTLGTSNSNVDQFDEDGPNT